MKPRNIVYVLLISGMLFGLKTYSDAKDEPQAKDGKTIFQDNKCFHCHAISAENIKSMRKPSPTGPPDLSDVGTKLKADFMQKFLKKNEELDGRKHPIEFHGPDEDLVTLTTWLETLKTAPKPPDEAK